jgi:hypothetical protein
MYTFCIFYDLIYFPDDPVLQVDHHYEIKGNEDGSEHVESFLSLLENIVDDDLKLFIPHLHKFIDFVDPVEQIQHIVLFYPLLYLPYIGIFILDIQLAGV